jgi:hypothetical protein
MSYAISLEADLMEATHIISKISPPNVSTNKLYIPGEVRSTSMALTTWLAATTIDAQLAMDLLSFIISEGYCNGEY